VHREAEVKALFWTLRIGDGVRVSQINRNSRRAWSVVRTLESMGLARVERLGRTKLVRLTEKGERVRMKLLEALRELNASEHALPSAEPLQVSELRASSLPEWLRGNPWLQVIGERGRT